MNTPDRKPLDIDNQPDDYIEKTRIAPTWDYVSKASMLPMTQHERDLLYRAFSRLVGHVLLGHHLVAVWSEVMPSSFYYTHPANSVTSFPGDYEYWTESHAIAMLLEPIRHHSLDKIKQAMPDAVFKGPDGEEIHPHLVAEANKRVKRALSVYAKPSKVPSSFSAPTVNFYAGLPQITTKSTSTTLLLTYKYPGGKSITHLRNSEDQNSLLRYDLGLNYLAKTETCDKGCYNGLSDRLQLQANNLGSVVFITLPLLKNLQGLGAGLVRTHEQTKANNAQAIQGRFRDPLSNIPPLREILIKCFAGVADHAIDGYDVYGMRTQILIQARATPEDKDSHLPPENMVLEDRLRTPFLMPTINLLPGGILDQGYWSGAARYQTQVDLLGELTMASFGLYCPILETIESMPDGAEKFGPHPTRLNGKPSDVMLPEGFVEAYTKANAFAAILSGESSNTITRAFVRKAVAALEAGFPIMGVSLPNRTEFAIKSCPHTAMRSQFFVADEAVESLAEFLHGECESIAKAHHQLHCEGKAIPICDSVQTVSPVPIDRIMQLCEDALQKKHPGMEHDVGLCERLDLLHEVLMKTYSEKWPASAFIPSSAQLKRSEVATFYLYGAIKSASIRSRSYLVITSRHVTETADSVIQKISEFAGPSSASISLTHNSIEAQLIGNHFFSYASIAVQDSPCLFHCLAAIRGPLTAREIDYAVNGYAHYTVRANCYGGVGRAPVTIKTGPLTNEVLPIILPTITSTPGNILLDAFTRRALYGF